MNNIELCIIEIIEVTENSPLTVREVYPNTSTIYGEGFLTSPLPIDSDGAGIHSIPKLHPGMRCIAVRYNGDYLITSFFHHRVPYLADRRAPNNVENMKQGDFHIRTGAGNRFSALSNGNIDIFSNIWARLHLNKAKEQFESFFRRIKIKWFGGSIESIDDYSTNLTLTQGFEKPSISDRDLDTEESPKFNFTSPNPTDTAYVNKAIIKNTEVPLQIETRENTGGRAAPIPANKDVFTVEKRGFHYDDENTVYSFVAKDKSRGTTSTQQITEKGINWHLECSDTIGTASQTNSSPKWSADIVAGESLQLNFSTSEVYSSLKFLDENNDNQVELKSNDHIITIGKNFRIARESDNNFEVKFDENGDFSITNANVVINSSADFVTISLLGNTKLKLGNDVSFEAGLDSVLTPQTILNGIDYDPFTGIPYKGSSSIGAQK